MVLRKRAPPRLHSLTQGNDRAGSRFPNSKLSPTSKSLSSSSPKRLTRPRRAQSSPQPHRVASEESVFSPDLNTSPAFDLMPLEQAQRSPIRTSAGDGSNPWADELTARFGLDHESPQAAVEHRAPSGEMASDTNQVPSISVPGAHERPDGRQPDRDYTGQSPVQLQSNNPFLKPRSPEPNPWEDRNARASYGESFQSQDGASVRLGQDEGYIPMTARLSLFDQPEAESPWVGEQTASMPPGIPAQPYGSHDPNQQYPGLSPDNQYSSANAPAAPYATQQTYLQPTQLHDDGRQSPARSMSTPVTLSSNTTGSSHVLIEFDEATNPPPEPGLKEVPQGYEYEPPMDPPVDPQQEKLVEAPPLPDRSKVAGSGVVPKSAWSGPISEAEAKRQQEQRSETYSIRHVNWMDSSRTLRESPVLVQNKNGPCPLLALVNALVLRSASHDSQSPIVKALQTREQISLGLLIEALFDELTTRLGPDDELPDIEALSRFLTMLHTGMNVNPRLTLESNDALGTFLETEDIRLYGTFGVPLIHGWVAAPSTEADAALARTAQYHEDIQLLPFRKQDLEDTVMRGNSLTPQEELVMDDIQTIQKFTNFDNATQLSAFGLEHLATKLQPGSFSILFRNDHFSTLYKHPQLCRLFTLVTDAGYSSHAEVVWERLVDVNGSEAGFYSGDFRPVSHNAPQHSDPSGPRTSSNSDHTSETQRNSAMTPQEQADADYAYALALQYQEEEQRENAANNRNPSQRASISHPPSGLASGTTYSRNRSSSAVHSSNGSYATAVSGNRSSRQSQRPGRYSQSQLPTVRPADDDEAPPSYEQAARTPVYPSPQRSPNFPDIPNASQYQRTQLGRRPPGMPISTGPSERVRERSKDCVVM
ncbi:uncharacterized protein BO80DRAFT_429893 [Aspergillus ibericus CBS 121593]|uniref:MINDY deubiquitinase domain-containing protein n=1 Tax=Aspergillus ibericus CBS 121593 TaxID=1448316 RepID=A0A395GIX3_9EURO|nr:hypothetical protein BO80DRAFT_429893 [Aspergillus ibericus CBS 121593]RAK95421.1 hypothetical protein BO80DRAFT_429893 [Aspergillus ibericus CBS 121593]